MPYEDERAGMAALRAIAEHGVVEDFRANMRELRIGDTLPDQPAFLPVPPGAARAKVLAIDGSHLYTQIPGVLPTTEAGLVSVSLVVIDMKKLRDLDQLPESGAVDPRVLRETETGKTLGMMLPGRNCERSDGLAPRDWFRHAFNDELARARMSSSGETYAETLYHLLQRGERPSVRDCPNRACNKRDLPIPRPGSRGRCESCDTEILLADGLRIVEQFDDNASVEQCHSRARDALEVLTLVNSLRCLRASEAWDALGNVAFVLDGQLAAFGTIAILAQAVRKEMEDLQRSLSAERPGATLLVMSGVKTGPFVEHAADLDRNPAPGKRIPPGHVWLPDNEYIRSRIVVRHANSEGEWGKLTHYGRPVVFKTSGAQRLVLNIAQPEIPASQSQSLNDLPSPNVLGDALATAGPLGMSPDQFLPLRRAHSQAAIPLRAGTDLIESLRE